MRDRGRPKFHLPQEMWLLSVRRMPYSLRESAPYEIGPRVAGPFRQAVHPAPRHFPHFPLSHDVPRSDNGPRWWCGSLRRFHRNDHTSSASLQSHGDELPGRCTKKHHIKNCSSGPSIDTAVCRSVVNFDTLDASIEN